MGRGRGMRTEMGQRGLVVTVRTWALLCMRQEPGEALSRGQTGSDLGLSLAKVWGL